MDGDTTTDERPRTRVPPRLGVLLDRALTILDIAVVDDDGGFDPAPWIERSLRELFVEADREAVTTALEGSGPEGPPEVQARCVFDPPSTPRFVRWGVGRRYVQVSLELPAAPSETLLARENRLEQLGMVASRISHDLKNLLGVVLINAELIPRTASNPEGILEISKEIVLAVERARELLEQILGHTRQGEQPRCRVDVNALTREMGRLLEVSAPPTVAIRYELESGLPWVLAHAPLLRQLLMNFIVNAGDAIGEEVGAITISTTAVHASAARLAETRTPSAPPPGRFVCLQVQDTGPGLDQQTADRIFDPFFTTKDKGHGLGLSACLGIVEQHRGALLLQSAPDEGATFQVLLPATAPGPRAPAPGGCPLAPPAAELELRGHAVLVIDDDPLVRSVVRRTLCGHGLDVLTARDGLDGLEMFERQHASLSCVLLDMGMTHVRGSDIFEDLRRIDPAVPVVFASGHDQALLRAEDAVFGAEGLLLKPFRERELLVILQRVIGAHGHARDGHAAGR